MLSSHKIKIIQSLDKKKFRQKYNLFLVEGNKIIQEIPNSAFKIKEIFSLNLENLKIRNVESSLISPAELKKISFLQHPKDSLALCELPLESPFQEFSKQIILDGIQDPGNLGTIIRLADWFGIEQIICSEDTVDYLNPKVLMASMGSFLRVKICYKNLEDFCAETENANLGTDMKGENIYQFQFPERFNLILGNEGKGMRPDTFKNLQHKITIPRFGNYQNTESLNVSMAAGIILGHIFSKK
ncbi:TrmH family RNA methyltransferase [Halpernia sp.]|uniref:TrmH family RNA methyltransferase n=1 Tax=Halpernia sp. TaxID=2782209 RepID=UPI003A94BB23